jgi:hypothetical protein
MIVETLIAAGLGQEYTERGDFFRVLEATGAVTVTFYRAGAEVAKAEQIQAGYAEKFDASEFDKVRIDASADVTIKFVVRLGNVVNYDKAPQGDVNVLNVNGAFVQAPNTVTNASGQLLAAKAGRRYVLIQNNDSGGDIYVTLDGSAATLAKGIKIAAGGSYECQGFAPTGAIFAIGSIASNANVVTVEA